MREVLRRRHLAAICLPVMNLTLTTTKDRQSALASLTYGIGGALILIDSTRVEQNWKRQLARRTPVLIVS